MAWDPLAAFGVGSDQAYQQQQQTLANLSGQIGGIYGGAQTGGIGALTGGMNAALGYLSPAYTSAQNYIQNYLPQAAGAITQGTGQGVQYLTDAQRNALSTLQGGVQGAVGAYAPVNTLAERFGGFADPAAQMYNNALGLGGPAGNAAATAAFRAD